MANFTLDTTNPPQLTPAERERLDSLTDAQITTAAKADPDNPPLTKTELGKLRSASLVQRARAL